MLGKGRRVEDVAEEAASISDMASTSSTLTSDEKSEDDEDGVRLESWVSWMQRVTNEAEEAMRAAGVQEWTGEVRRRKWRWAGHVARRTDDRWARQVLEWKPDGARLQGRPVTRWVDDIRQFMTSLHGEEVRDEDWMRAAQCREHWAALEEDYVNRTCAEV